MWRGPDPVALILFNRILLQCVQNVRFSRLRCVQTGTGNLCHNETMMVAERHFQRTGDGSPGQIKRVGTLMPTIQAVMFGVLLALTPSLVLLAILLWRERVGFGIDEGTYRHPPSCI